MRVVLSPNEMRMACQHGVERYISALTRDARGKLTSGQPENRADVDLIGCMAEMALAKALNLYWSGVEEINSPDVGQYEVRSTRRLDGNLIIRDRDKPNQKAVLVTCDPPVFNVIGFILVSKGKQDNWIYDDGKGKCWIVPQAALERFDEDKVKQVSSVDQDTWLFDL